ncbi:MAG: hypothetical protein JWM27_3057 [Gemmatimonadetes bacterium]|nr:hypothetical protein [Gemmatimonadota bacterium]
MRPFAAAFAALALLGIADTAATAQQAIRAGMSAEQVRAAFGAPARTREQGDWTYWFYANGCPVRCGSDDVVFLQDGKVVAAVLRTGTRQFDGPNASASLASIEGIPAADGPRGTGLVRLPGRRTARHRPVRPVTASASTVARASSTTTRSARRGADGSTRMTVRHVGRAGVEAGDDASPSVAGRPGAPAVRSAAGVGTPAVVGGVRVQSTTGRQGSRAALADSAGLGRSRTTNDSSPDQERTNRERAVTPRVVPAPKAGIHP